VIRCVRYAFAYIPAEIGRVFFSKLVALPFLRFRMLRHGYLKSPIHWHGVKQVMIHSPPWDKKAAITNTEAHRDIWKDSGLFLMNRRNLMLSFTTPTVSYSCSKRGESIDIDHLQVVGLQWVPVTSILNSSSRG
jgi:hypothetical protein